MDASVLANALVYADDRGRRARSILSADPEWAAPEHWKIELFSVMRGLALGNKISDGQAQATINRIPQLGVDHVPVEQLL
ncbi:type II toxin-antitoxin system VapC family toxin, partial [Frankia sp. CcWB2]